MIKEPLKDLSTAEFLAGELILVDKPESWTSFDVVNKIRFALKGLLGIKKIKVGHSGTLDPKATGLLVICIGKMTKKIEQLQGLDKEYTGTLRLGATTPSYDAESDIDQEYPWEHIDLELLENTRDQFLGEQKQIPPMFSAIKVDGQPLYKLARKGQTRELKARDIKIHNFEINGFDAPEVSFTVHCSKGTYIRSLAFDFGKALDSGAYLSSLRRTEIGPYSLSDAWVLDDLIRSLEKLKMEGSIPNEPPPPSSQ
ncbi:MAG: tRNA pseudouridine(55) synthase TruB [Saprospiraceae bacterium]|nr:tRNA pseudouridine(55) synthase TruB [Saprospiraceae bacterium]